MELRHLRYFVAVAEERHFGRAAARLYMSQSPLSSQIRRLEEDLGTPLFHRTSRSVTLTSAGRALLPRARRALLEAQLAERAARDAASGKRVVRVDLWAGECREPRALLKQVRRCNLELALVERRTAPDLQPSRLEAGVADVGLAPAAVWPAELATRWIGDEPLVAYVPAHASRGGILAPEALACVSLVRLWRTSVPGLGTAVETWLRRHGVAPLWTDDEVDDIAGALALVCDRDAVLVAPALAGPPPDAVRAVSLSPEGPSLPWTLTWSAARHCPLLEELAASTRPLPLAA